MRKEKICTQETGVLSFLNGDSEAFARKLAFEERLSHSVSASSAEKKKKEERNVSQKKVSVCHRCERGNRTFFTCILLTIFLTFSS